MRTTRLLPLLGVLATTTFFSCSEPPAAEPKDMIVGKWEYVRMEIPPAAMAQADEMDQYDLLRLEGMLKMASWEYFKDGTYKMNMGNSQVGKSDGGTYSLINDGQVLKESSTDKRGDVQTKDRQILLLTNDTLKVGDANSYVVLVKTSK